MRSLKTARPLLASVAYFVLFAMVLFSYVVGRSVLGSDLMPRLLTRVIGVQTFKGSFRRSCFLESTLGEPEIQLSHSCGGYIDPGNFSVMPYIAQDGQNISTKGYICPLGQVCRVRQYFFSTISPNDKKSRRQQPIPMVISRALTRFTMLLCKCS